MSRRPTIVHVGAADPELKTSVIIEDTREDYDELGAEVHEQPVCHFNGVEYPHGQYLCCGSTELLRCEQGSWVMEGSCDPDNP